MSEIDYSNLLNPTIESNKNIREEKNKNNNFKFAKDIFEFVESPEFIGEELLPRQKEILKKYYETENPKTQKRLFQELVIISGMRSGKTRLAAYIGAYETHKLLEIIEKGETLTEFFKKKNVRVGTGQRIYLIVVAASLDQAESTTFSQMKGIFENTLWFSKYIEYLKSKKQYSSDKFEIRFFNTVYIKAEDSNSATQVGKTIYALLFDEISRLDVSDSEIAKKTQKRSAQMVYQGLSKGTTTFRESRHIIVISAPVHEDDFGMQLLMRSGDINVCEETKDHIYTLAKKYPEKVPSRLGYHSTTFDFNPTIDRENDPFIAGVRVSSPLAYKRDYIAIPPSGVDSYFEDPAKIDECYRDSEETFIEDFIHTIEVQVEDPLGGTLKREYIGRDILSINTGNSVLPYVVCCDQAAKRDSFVVTIGHAEFVEVESDKGERLKKVKTVIDHIATWKPDRENHIEVSFDSVIKYIISLRRKIHIERLTFDQWSIDEFSQRLFKLGIRVEKLGIDLGMYEILKNSINNGLVSLPSQENNENNYRLGQELKRLQLIRNKHIDHPPNYTKDIADTVARVNYILTDHHSSRLEDKVRTEQSISYSGFSPVFKEKVLSKVLPVLEGLSNNTSKNNPFIIPSTWA